MSVERFMLVSPNTNRTEEDITFLLGIRDDVAQKLEFPMNIRPWRKIAHALIALAASIAIGSAATDLRLSGVPAQPATETPAAITQAIWAGRYFRSSETSNSLRLFSNFLIASSHIDALFWVHHLPSIHPFRKFNRDRRHGVKILTTTDCGVVQREAGSAPSFGRCRGAVREEARYWAFISYSHKDAAFGRKLHRRLESYRLPERLVGRETARGTVPRRLVPIFRDREEFPAAGDLSAEVRTALQVRSLIVVCSPAAAVALGLAGIAPVPSVHPEGPVLTVIIDGQPP